MAGMFDLDGIRQRIATLVAYRAAQDQAMRAEAILPLTHVFALGPVKRGEFACMTGLRERSARKLLAKLLADGLLVSDSPHGPVRFGLPLDALNILFPNLYPEANLPLNAA